MMKCRGVFLACILVGCESGSDAIQTLNDDVKMESKSVEEKRTTVISKHTLDLNDPEKVIKELCPRVLTGENEMFSEDKHVRWTIQDKLDHCLLDAELLRIDEYAESSFVISINGVPETEQGAVERAIKLCKLLSFPESELARLSAWSRSRQTPVDASLTLIRTVKGRQYVVELRQSFEETADARVLFEMYLREELTDAESPPNH